jgi:hypothetical protein
MSIVSDFFAVVIAIAMAWLDGEHASALRAIRHVAINSNGLSQHFEIAGCADDFSAVRRLVTETDDAATFAVFHIDLAR